MFIPLTHQVINFDFGIERILVSALMTVRLALRIRIYKNSVIRVIITIAIERVGIAFVIIPRVIQFCKSPRNKTLSLC